MQFAVHMVSAASDAKKTRLCTQPVQSASLQLHSKNLVVDHAYAQLRQCSSGVASVYMYTPSVGTTGDVVISCVYVSCCVLCAAVFSLMQSSRLLRYLIHSDIHENSLAVLAAVKFGNEWIGQRHCDREV